MAVGSELQCAALERMGTWWPPCHDYPEHKDVVGLVTRLTDIIPSKTNQEPMRHIHLKDARFLLYSRQIVLHKRQLRGRPNPQDQMKKDMEVSLLKDISPQTYQRGWN